MYNHTVQCAWMQVEYLYHLLEGNRPAVQVALGNHHVCKWSVCAFWLEGKCLLCKLPQDRTSISEVEVGWQQQHVLMQHGGFPSIYWHEHSTCIVWCHTEYQVTYNVCIHFDHVGLCQLRTKLFCTQLTKAYVAETSCISCHWFCYVSAHDHFAQYRQRSNEPLRQYINVL